MVLGVSVALHCGRELFSGKAAGAGEETGIYDDLIYV